MSVPGSGSAQYIIDHYRLRATGVEEPLLKTIVTLITNGLYYQQVNNPISALVSFSSAASYIYALKESSAAPTKLYDPTLNIILGHVEALQQKTQMIGTSDKKDEEDVSWSKDCINLCEKKSNSLCLTFADVIGMTKEKNTMVTSIIKPLVYPNLFTKSAKGVLLYGPPGTGKTYLVKALVRQLQIEYADSAQVLFFPLTGADLKGKYVGETEKKIVRAYTCAARRACQATDPFNEDSVCTAKDANKVLKNLSESSNQKIGKSPQYVSVIFIDEFDSIGGDRSNDDTGLVANSVNTLLQMMDGIVSFKNIITVAATNYPWSLDPALLRRFNEHIYCTVPSINHIKQLVEMEMKERFDIQKKNHRDYCAVDIDSKVFKPSQELAKFVGQKKEREGCGPSVEERIKNASWPLNIIDRRYMAMDSPEAESLIVHMKTENYSNSDIASVVQKAFNITSEACINDGTWFRITPGAKSFIEEATTELENLTKKGADQSEIDLATSRLEVLKKNEEEEAATEVYASQIQQLGQLVALPAIKTTDTNPAYSEDIRYYEGELASIQKDKKTIAGLRAEAELEKVANANAPEAVGGGGASAPSPPQTSAADALKEAIEKFALEHPNSEKEVFLSLVEAINKYNRPVGQKHKTVEEKILTNVSLDEQELSKRIKQLYDEQVLSNVALASASAPKASAEALAELAAAKDAEKTASAVLAHMQSEIIRDKAELLNIDKQTWFFAKKASAKQAIQGAIDQREAALPAALATLEQAKKDLATAEAAMPSIPDPTKKYQASLSNFETPLPPHKKGIIEKDVLPACGAYLKAVEASIKANSAYILNVILSAKSLSNNDDEPDADGKSRIEDAINRILHMPRRADITDMLSDYAYAAAHFEFGKNSVAKLTELPSQYDAAIEKAAALAKGNDNMACQYKIAYLRLINEKTYVENLLSMSAKSGADHIKIETEQIDEHCRSIDVKIAVQNKILSILAGDATVDPADKFQTDIQTFYNDHTRDNGVSNLKKLLVAATLEATAKRDAYSKASATAQGVPATKKRTAEKAQAEADASTAMGEYTTALEKEGNALAEYSTKAQDKTVNGPIIEKIRHHKKIKEQLERQKASVPSLEFIHDYGSSIQGPPKFWEVKQRFLREKYLYEQRVAANTEDFVTNTNHFIFYDLLVSQLPASVFKNSPEKREEYFISKMTKIIKDVDPITYNLIDSAASLLDKQAKKDSIYENGKTDSKLLVPPTVVIDMFGGSTKNIFGNAKKTRMITSINFFSKKYINSKLIKDLPAELIFKDDSIADIFFTESDVKTYRANKSNTAAHKNTFIKIMFTRVLSVMNDNAAAVIMPKKHGIVVAFEQITTILEELVSKAVLGSGDASRVFELLAPLREYDSEIARAHTELTAISAMPVERMWGTKNQDAKTEAFKTWITTYQDYFSTYEEKKIVSTALLYYKQKKAQMLPIFNSKSDGDGLEEGDCSAITDKIDKLIKFANSFADYIDDITKEELTEAKTHYMGSPAIEQTAPYSLQAVENCTATYNHTKTSLILDGIDRITDVLTAKLANTFKPPENNDPAKTVKKVFFFLAKIRPFSAAWTQFKAGGTQWSDGIVSNVSGWWAGMRLSWSTAAKTQGVKPITDNEIRAEIAKNKRTVADYLLLRTTHVGICNGENDSTFYEIGEDEIKTQELCPEIPEEDELDEVTIMDSLTDKRTPAITEAIQKYKLAREAAVALKVSDRFRTAVVTRHDPDSDALKLLNNPTRKGQGDQTTARQTHIGVWTDALKKLSAEDKANNYILEAAKILNPKFKGGGTRKNHRVRANLTRRIGGASVPRAVSTSKGKGIDDNEPQNIMWFVIPLEKTEINFTTIERQVAISLFGIAWMTAGDRQIYWPNLVIATMFMNDNFIVNKLSSDFTNFPELFNINYQKAVVQRASYINKALHALNFKLIRYSPQYDTGTWYEYIPYFIAAWGINSASERHFGKSIVDCVFGGIKSATGSVVEYFSPSAPTDPVAADTLSVNLMIAEGAKAAPPMELTASTGVSEDVLAAGRAALPDLQRAPAQAAATALGNAANSALVDLADARAALKLAQEHLDGAAAGFRIDETASVEAARAAVTQKLAAAQAALVSGQAAAKAAAIALVPTEADIIAAAGEEVSLGQGRKLAANFLRENMSIVVEDAQKNMAAWLANPPSVGQAPATAAAAILPSDPHSMFKVAQTLALDAFIQAGPTIPSVLKIHAQTAALNDIVLRAYIELDTELKGEAKSIKKLNIKQWLNDYNTVSWHNLSDEARVSYIPFDDCPLAVQGGGGYSDEEYSDEEYEEYEEEEEEMEDEEMEDKELDSQSGGSSTVPLPSGNPPLPSGAPPINRRSRAVRSNAAPKGLSFAQVAARPPPTISELRTAATAAAATAQLARAAVGSGKGVKTREAAAVAAERIAATAASVLLAATTAAAPPAVQGGPDSGATTAPPPGSSARSPAPPAVKGAPGSTASGSPAPSAVQGGPGSATSGPRVPSGSAQVSSSSTASGASVLSAVQGGPDSGATTPASSGSGTPPGSATVPSVLGAPPPQPPPAPRNQTGYDDDVARLTVIFNQANLSKNDICTAYQIFCNGAKKAGHAGNTLDVKGLYMLILIKFIKTAVPEKVKATMPKMDAVSSSLFTDIIKPFVRGAVIAAITTYGLPAAVGTATATFGYGALWASSAFLVDVGIRLHEAEGFRQSQMTALEREILTYLQTKVPSNYLQINVKEVIQSGVIDRTKCLNFYMDPGFLKAAADSYPSTWNEENGKKFAEYDTNRAQFMAKEAAARDARKNR